jgi:ankyrin repeat protein
MFKIMRMAFVALFFLHSAVVVGMGFDPKKDHYRILGVRSDASQSEITRAYKILALKYHPDRNHAHGAATKFKEINNAQEVLRDEQKRKQYDAMRGVQPEPMRPQPTTSNVQDDVVFINAVEQQDIKTVEKFIKQGFDVNKDIAMGPFSVQKMRALHLAAEKGNADIVNLLIRAGANVNSTIGRQATPLHFATQEKLASETKLEVIRALLNAGANVALIDTFGRKPVALIDKVKEPQVYKLLKDAEDVLYRKLLDAIKNKNKEEFKALTPGYFDMSIRGNSKDGNSILHWAAFRGADEIVYYYFSKSLGEVNLQNEKGQTPLHMAVLASPLTEGHAGVVNLLIVHGANVGFLTKNERKAIDLVKKDKNPEIYSSLKEAENNLYKRMIDAVKKQNKTIVEDLTRGKFGVKIEGESSDGNTPLHWAVFKGNVGIVTHLLGNGARINKQNKQGQTPLHMVLLAKTFTVRHIEVLKLLVDGGADVTIKTVKGTKAIDLVKKDKYPSLYQLLEKAEHSK